jgi:SRSO17 transposase
MTNVVVNRELVRQRSSLRGLPPFDVERSRQFEAYVEGLRSVFPRSDQVHRFRAYLRGLLEPGVRKNVESIAAVAGQSLVVEADLAQALQHFVSQSPWDTRRLLSAGRQQSLALRADRGAVWVVQDAAFAKKGQHSVGVMRQYARGVGRKINCQLGVVIAQLGPRGYFPLVARLYLPVSWLKENQDVASKGIPEEYRVFASKSDIALALIDELRAEGEPVRPVIAEAGYSADEVFQNGLKERELKMAEGQSRDLETASAHQAWLREELGLDHFEGRTWHGWHHHVGLVFTAHMFAAWEAAK